MLSPSIGAFNRVMCLDLRTPVTRGQCNGNMCLVHCDVTADKFIILRTFKSLFDLTFLTSEVLQILLVKKSSKEI